MYNDQNLIMDGFLICLLGLTFTSLLLLLAWIDLKERILPDILTFSLLWLGLLSNPIFHFVNLYDGILGAVFGYLGLWVVYQGYKYVSHKEGLGFGDFKLLAALGAWFGWQMLPLLLFIATSTTLFYLVLLKLLKRYPQDPCIPLGPGLSFAGVVVFLLNCLTIN